VSVTTLLITLLATARITRLITSDRLTQAPRLWAAEKIEERAPMLFYLITCDWCASVYVGTAVAGAWAAWGDTLWFQVPALALGASYATGFLAERTNG
jgi:hypothetical protein